jgi:preprotein translocase subunit SecA
MLTKIISWIIGTKNQRIIRGYKKIVDKINSLEPKMQALDDSQFSAMTIHFKERLAKGESLEDLLPEAFALVREASVRTIGLRHFDVQMMGGIALHEGNVAEMKTGEGKTLVATLPLYLNALQEKGVHLITVNDYLASRDAAWNKPIYNLLGLEVSCIKNSMEDVDRQQAYRADITYGTNSEFGFDYLRDNMKFSSEDQVQRGYHYAIVDEVDSILIDEARTPLIISGPSEKVGSMYQDANSAVKRLSSDCFEIDEKARTVLLTEKGVDAVEKFLQIENIYAPEHVLVLHHVQQALRAHTLFKRDVDYLVSQENEVLIIDEFTGRTLPGRRYSDGLHQALEAKEGVEIERENQTLATISLQNYFRMYKKLAGMTGTAATDAHEFHKIYKLGVIKIPTNKPMIRDDQQDLIFLTKEDKYGLVLQDIQECYRKGQPVLVGTASVEDSEFLSAMLNKCSIPHEVLNAKNHAREAEIIKLAGQVARVTISTSMAGRGTDIKLGEGVAQLGGLRVIGTERQENRRVDDQLRGRSGRQGDPGSTRFYISLEDDLMRIFGGDRTKYLMEKYAGMVKGESIEHNLVTSLVASNQEKLERRNFDRRKQLLEYDDVANQQRTVIYKYRNNAMAGGHDFSDLVKDMLYEAVCDIFEAHLPLSHVGEQEKVTVLQIIGDSAGLKEQLLQQNFSVGDTEQLKHEIVDFLALKYEEMRAAWPQDLVERAEKWIVLETIDFAWKAHLQNIDHLQEGIGLRGYAQKNPLYEYKKESFEQFEQMMRMIRLDVFRRLFRLKPSENSKQAIDKIEQEKERELAKVKTVSSSLDLDNAAVAPETVKRDGPKVGRNDACTCGSGKKFKQCCGR